MFIFLPSMETWRISPAWVRKQYLILDIRKTRWLSLQKSRKPDGPPPSGIITQTNDPRQSVLNNGGKELDAPAVEVTVIYPDRIYLEYALLPIALIQVSRKYETQPVNPEVSGQQSLKGSRQPVSPAEALFRYLWTCQPS
jgi:hypothetical protein